MTYRVLIADDSITIRKLIEMVLSKEGYDLLFVENGLDLIKGVFSLKPDLIVSDVTMPFMNGYQACTFLKSEPMTREIPFILLTAKSEKSDQFWGIKTGADAYLTKPFDPDMLKKVVRDCLEEAKESTVEFEEIEYSTEELIGKVNGLLDKKLYEMTILYEISTLGTYIDDFTELVVEVFNTVNKIIDFDSIFLYLLEENTFYTKHRFSEEINNMIQCGVNEYLQKKCDDGFKLSDTWRKKIVTSEILPGTVEENKDFPHYFTLLQIRGKPIAVMGILNRNRNKLNSSIMNLFDLLANQVGMVIDNARLYAQIKNYGESKAQSLTILNEVGKMMSSLTEIDKLLQMVIHLGVNVSKATGGALFLYDNEMNVLGLKASIRKDFIKEGMDHINIGQGITGDTLLTCSPMLINDLQEIDQKKLEDDIFRLDMIKNMIIVPLISKDRVLGVLEVYNKIDYGKFSKDDLDVIMTLGNQIAIAVNNAILYTSTEELFLSTIQSLSSAIDAKDQYTHGHSYRVTEYSICIAREMKLSDSFINIVHLSGLLHDIGKIGISESILCKPSRLTDEEYIEIKKHPLIGATIMEPIKPLRKVIPGMKYHHERWDGRGYPDGLKGLETPLIARIIGVADTFDAMTSDRSYRKGLDPSIAYEEINKCSGSQFDPDIVKFFNIAYENQKIIEILRA
ncbi:response regulator [bacterium]|nr:response regulator [bacterium]